MKKKIMLIIMLFTFFINSEVYAASIKLNQHNVNLGVGYNTTLKVVDTGGSSGTTVVWTSSDSSVATVNNGVVTGVKPGEAIITAKIGAEQAICKVVVINNFVPITGIRFSNSKETILVGSTQKLSVIVTPSNASNQSLSYTSSNSNVATVDSEGNVKGITVGEAYITVSAAGYQAVANIKVINTISLNSISISKNLQLKEQSSSTLNVTFNPSNATNKKVTWKSSNPNVATVDSSGNVKAIAPGTATITVISSDGGKVATCNVEVIALSKKLTGISLNKTELTMELDAEETLTVNFNPEYAENKNIKWSSSNTKIAKVSNGKVTPVKPGKVEIKAVSEDGNYEAVCQVTVLSPPIESIKFAQTKQSVALGSTITLKTVSTPTDTAINNPIWTSSDETVATVKDGVLTALKLGTTIITISNEDGSIKAKTTITVVEKVVSDLSIKVKGYDLKFDPEKYEYSLLIGSETSLDFDINVDSSNVTISGNKNLKNDSVITITIKGNKKPYVITIKKKESYTIYFIGIVSFLLMINIIRMLIKSKKKKALQSKSVKAKKNTPTAKSKSSKSKKSFNKKGR